MSIDPEKDVLIDTIMNMFSHELGMHNPMVMYGYNDAGERVFIKSVNRREKNCKGCDELYKKYPVVTIG